MLLSCCLKLHFLSILLHFYQVACVFYIILSLFFFSILLQYFRTFCFLHFSVNSLEVRVKGMWKVFAFIVVMFHIYCTCQCGIPGGEKKKIERERKLKQKWGGGGTHLVCPLWLSEVKRRQISCFSRLLGLLFEVRHCTGQVAGAEGGRPHGPTTARSGRRVMQRDQAQGSACRHKPLPQMRLGLFISSLPAHPKAFTPLQFISSWKAQQI